jgi:hypothetical protein
MLTVPVEIKKSPIHGYGVFASEPIRQDAVVWMFHPGLDQRMTKFALKFAEPRVKEFVLKRGYINPKSPEEYVICIDEAQFMNFPPADKSANLKLGGLQDKEQMLLAAVEILAGEELTVPPQSDADYARKMQAYGPK